MTTFTRNTRNSVISDSGISAKEGESPLDVAKTMHIPSICTTPVYWGDSSTGRQETKYVAIVGRTSVNGDANPNPHYKYNTYGVVSASTYNLIPHVGNPQNPTGFLDIWNEEVPYPVDTLGLVGRGESLFISVKLPSYEIKGDEITPRLIGINPCDGKSSIKALICPIRFTCQNMLRVALKNASESLKIPHTRHAVSSLRTWLRDVVAHAEETSNLIKEACELLSNTYPGPLKIDHVLAETYPLIKMPETDDLGVLAGWEAFCKSQETHKEAVKDLIIDSPTLTRSTTGNLWGVYNAVVEYEDFYKPKRTAMSAFLGEASKRKESAFRACMSLV